MKWTKSVYGQKGQERYVFQMEGGGMFQRKGKKGEKKVRGVSRNGGEYWMLLGMQESKGLFLIIQSPPQP